MANAPRDRQRPLKDKTNLRLGAAVLANLIVYAVVINGDRIDAGGWDAAWRAARELLPAAAMLVIITVVNGLIDHHNKARLVFWRWRYPLPGCRAFSVHAKRDPRINVPALRAKLGQFPKSEAEQNSTWYRLYRSIETDAAVAHVHQDFLFTRDFAALSALTIPLLGATAFVQAGFGQRSVLYVTFLITQYGVTSFAAANYGKRFVATVLAIKSAEA